MPILQANAYAMAYAALLMLVIGFASDQVDTSPGSMSDYRVLL
jgi:hypothetical protein